jgi:hypothetical protein
MKLAANPTLSVVEERGDGQNEYENTGETTMLALILSGSLLLLAAPVPVPEPPKNGDAPPDGVFARTYWQPAAALHKGGHHYVFRDGKALADAMKVTGSSADETATAMLAKQLGVKAIDWKKQMVVTVAAGLQGAEADRLFITRVVVQDDALSVYYQLRVEEKLQPTGDKDDGKPPAKGAGGFGYPAETVLVNRYDGAIRLKDETPKPAPKKE